MSWLAELATASTLGSLVLALIYAHLYARERRPYHLIGAAAWGVYLLWGITAAYARASAAPLPMPLSAAAALVMAGLLLWALAAWRNVRLPVWAGGTVALCLAALVAVRWLPSLASPVLLAGTLFIAALRVAGAYLVYRTPAGRPLRLAVALAMALWALATPVDTLPLAQNVPPIAAYHAVANVLAMLVGVGLVVVYLGGSDPLRGDDRAWGELFEQAPDIMLVSRAEDGQVLGANQAACRALGFARDDLLRMSLAALDAGSPPIVPAHLAAAQSLGQATSETRLRRSDGSLLACELISRPLGPAQRPAILTIAHDLGARLAVEQALHQEQVSAQRYLDLAGSLFVAVDAGGEILLANRRACAAFGSTPSEILGTNWLARFSSPGQRLSAQDALAHVMAGRAESSEIDGDLRTAGGNSRHVTWRCVPIRDDNGRVAAALCAGEDDTAQRDSQQLFDDLVGVLNDIVYTIDTDQRLTSVFGDLGDGERRVTGSVEMAPRGALGEAAARDHDQANRRALAGEHVVFEWTLSADPTSYHLETSLAPLHSHAGEIVGAIGVIRDVSLLHQMRRQLQAHERCFSTLLSNVPGTVYRCRYDTHWTMEAISAGCLALTGYSPDALVGNRDVAFADLIHPDDRDQVAEAVDRAVAEDRPFQVEYRLLDASGQEKRVWEQGCAVLTSEQPGEAVMLEGYITDVTVLYQAQKALRASEARYRAIFDVAPSLVVSLDTAQRVRECNGRVQEMLGLSPDELGGQPLKHWIDPADQPALSAALDQVLRGHGSHHHEYRLRHHDGKTVDVDFRCSLLQDDSPEPQIVCLIEDISERKLLHAQLRQMQKMEALGRLAGAVAHDFNNLLTVIGGYGHMALESLPPQHPTRQDLEQILAAGDRAGSLTRQLLLFSRRHEVDMVVLDLNEVLREVESMLERLIGEDVRLEMRLDPQLHPIKADARLIEQVLINLAVNARDAMPSGGELRIETTNVTLSPEGASPYPRMRPGDYAMLAVSDTGTGMTADVLEHLFEPFFTTKEPGKGTGLGLSSVYAIVEQMHGDIQVYTAPGQGSRFMIYLPATADTQSAPKREMAPQTPRGTETILLVEDQREVRDLVARILTRLGYTVLPAGNGAEALAATRECAGRIDLVLSDVIMPDQMGPEIVKALRGEYPDLRVLFMSGYTDQALAGYGVSSRDLALIQKPFTIQELAVRLRQVLDGRIA